MRLLRPPYRSRLCSERTFSRRTDTGEKCCAHHHYYCIETSSRIYLPLVIEKVRVIHFTLARHRLRGRSDLL